MTFLRCVIRCIGNLKVKTVRNFSGGQVGRRLALMQRSDIMVPGKISVHFYTDTHLNYAVILFSYACVSKAVRAALISLAVQGKRIFLLFCCYALFTGPLIKGFRFECDCQERESHLEKKPIICKIYYFLKCTTYIKHEFVCF